MSKRLKYIDSYAVDGTGIVIDIKKEGDMWAVALDCTPFIPEGGGQSGDTGTINDIPVLGVFERGGEIFHIMPQPLAVGTIGVCKVDFDKRFEKMQCHTAEHILCGIIHNIYGYENVGFHLGDEVVTFDIDGELTREQLEEVERLANKAVFDNLPVTSRMPSKEELASLNYRSKLEFMDEVVRLVAIGDIDLCACCAPHVANTGEIGIIKILDFMRHRGGLRITMLAGHRAIADYSRRCISDKRIGGLLSTPAHDIAAAVEHLYREYEAKKHSLDLMELKVSRLEAQKVTATDGNALYYFPDMSLDALREFSNCATDRVAGVLVALSGSDGDFKYIISSRSRDLRAEAKNINAALGGRGGGRPEMIQGSLSATLEDIKDYFETK